MERFSVKSISFVYGGINLTVIQPHPCSETMQTFTIIQRMVNKAKDQTKDLSVKMVVSIIIFRARTTQTMDHYKIFHSVHLNPAVLVVSVNNYHLIHKAIQDILQAVKVIRVQVIHRALIRAPIQAPIHQVEPLDQLLRLVIASVHQFNLSLLALVLFQTFLLHKSHPDQALFHQASHRHRSVLKITQSCHQTKFLNLVSHRLFHKIFQAAQLLSV